MKKSLRRMSLEELVQEFATNVAAQTDEIHNPNGTSKKGNRYAKRYIDAFNELRARGDAGRDALAVLFSHPRMDVRVMAAAFLLRHRTAEAKQVLEHAAKGHGLAALGAQMSLKHWQEGLWELDPEQEE